MDNARDRTGTPPKTVDDTAEATRGAILEAANRRFSQFGYNKTTMAEIADDCDMSAANLYRFFRNKLDIGARLACGCLETQLAGTRAIIAQSERPAAERLRDVFLHVLDYTHDQWANDPRMNELVTAICEARMDIVDAYKQDQHAQLVELLDDGVRRGEFSVSDAERTAEAIITTMTAFSMPLLMPLYSLETFQRRAEGVVDLLLDGLRARP